MLKLGKTMAGNGKMCGLKTGKRTASWQAGKHEFVGLPICMTVFIFQ